MRNRVVASAVVSLSCLVLTGCPTGNEDDPGSSGDPGSSSSSSGGAVEPPQTPAPTDEGCGGTQNPPCANGKKCKVSKDCQSGACKDGVCVVATGSDGIQNGTESDVDCGGAAPTNAPKCADGTKCGAGDDCVSLSCKGGVCAAPTSDDGVKNGTETDVDCGGSAAAPKCLDGKKCAAAGDCASGVCTGGTCQAPTKTDGVKNGTETDVDCGGGAPTNAPKCAAGKTCKVHADCGSDGCGDDGKCATTRSCAQQNGGRTCGAGQNEDCCTSITVPAGTPYKLDKFSITSGRMRQFVTRTNGNMRAFIQANRPAGWNASWDAYLPNRIGDQNDAAEYDTVVSELGPVIHGTPGGANMGCYISNVDYGARTYWLPPAVNAAFCEPGKTCAQKYDQATLDKKLLNCVPFAVLAAFCHWDGGRLASITELDTAWNGVGTTRTYPWGNTPAPTGYNNAYPDKGTAGTSYQSPVPPADPNRANYFYNFWSPAAVSGLDQSIYVAIPGSFPTGAGPYGHMDLAGGVFNMTTPANFAGQGSAVRWSRNGSWQGHGIPYGALSPPITNKYWATGGRCSRP
ncbi:MAG: hypothetical protein JNL38_37270 [Myxococcales bacterium]|nr:hypothetical protein [Myxococcales bacterium]